MAIDMTTGHIKLKRDVVGVLAPQAATANSNNLAEDFVITPSQGTEKMLILVSVANTHGTVKCKLMAGDFSAKKDLEFDAVQNVTTAIAVTDDMRFKKYHTMESNTYVPGTIVLRLTPAAGKKLQSEHAATVQVIEMPTI